MFFIIIVFRALLKTHICFSGYFCNSLNIVAYNEFDEGEKKNRTKHFKAARKGNGKRNNGHFLRLNWLNYRGLEILKRQFGKEAKYKRPQSGGARFSVKQHPESGRHDVAGGGHADWMGVPAVCRVGERGLLG